VLDRVNRAVGALLVLLGLGAIGCNATCIRDSDCLGESVCTENRCILIARRDAGRGSSSSPDDTNDVSHEPDASTERDAGN
jgi:hypothetical protein